MDLYVVLGVPRRATPDEIRRAYRRLARRFHPDINPGDRVAASQFEQIVQAYETLTDPERRSRYDGGGEHSSLKGGPPTSGFEGFDFTASGSEQATSFGDLFAGVIAERTKGRAAQRGVDLHGTVRLSFEESLQGVRRMVAVTRHASCNACDGSGSSVPTSGVCLLCRGTGAVRSSRRYMVFSRSCPSCAGTGSERPAPCGQCAGSGRHTRSEQVAVDVPPGIEDGERVRVAGCGHAGTGGGPPGDLYLTVQVETHPAFRREGDDVHVVVPVAVHEAALGSRVDVSTPDGGITLRVPPGTQSGQRFRLRGRGAASRQAAGLRGDLVVEVRLMLPAVLDERSKELLREFGRINGAQTDVGRPFEG
jgi:molecular chaperone DnaJ